VSLEAAADRSGSIFARLSCLISSSFVFITVLAADVVLFFKELELLAQLDQQIIVWLLIECLVKSIM